MISSASLLQWLDKTLEPEKFSDYCPNGLQVQGRSNIQHIVTGVTASLALIDKACEIGADTILVHHGWFWRNEDPTIRGQRYHRIKRLIEAGINLIAYHLPLDAHPTLGNNAQLARRLGLEPFRDESGKPVTCGPGGLVWLGSPQPGQESIQGLLKKVESSLGRKPVWIGQDHGATGTVAWCTGGAQNMYEAAIAAGANTYITGEISEPSAHIARESDTTFISAGHHATERYGVMALGEAVKKELGVKVTFIDIDNPA